MDNFKTIEWYRAVTMQERISIFKKIKPEEVDCHPNLELGKMRMNEWISRSSFTNESHFNTWLQSVGITEKEFLFILSDPKCIVTESNIYSAGWFLDILQAFCRRSTYMEGSHLPSRTTRIQRIGGFMSVIEPLIEQALQRLRDGIHNIMSTYTSAPFNENEIESILTSNLPNRILGKLNRTLILELNVARLKGILAGDNSSDRFKSFLEMIRQKDKCISLLKEYPVLARQLTLTLNQWVRFSLEFLTHLCIDYEKLRTTFNQGHNLGTLVDLQSDVGDRHRDGRSVSILRFSSGFRVVYKPRSMALDLHFQDLLHWINNRLGWPLFYTMKILNSGTYGWEEYVPREDCIKETQVDFFYKRMGGYLCILYLLRANDFHSENVIAYGEHPILIDLETLFQPRYNKTKSKLANNIAHEILNYSVLHVGLLPQWRSAVDKPNAVDLSGIGTKIDQNVQFEISGFEGTNTDEMRIIPKQVQITKLNNRPRLNQIEVDEILHIDAIIAGFTMIYQLIMQHKIDLLAENGLLTKFSRDEIRVVLRPTQTYAILLYESYHPDVLKDSFDRDLLLNQLWTQISYYPRLARVIFMELEDLERGDIPIFTSYPASRAIWSSSRISSEHFFNESGISLTRKLVRDMSENDLERQIWIIRASLATISRTNVPSQGPTPAFSSRSKKVNSKHLLLASRAVANRLEELVIRGVKDASWIGLEFHTSKDQLSLMPLGTDLYDGLPGIAIFLGYLGIVTQERRYTELARATLLNIQHQIEHKSFRTGIGAFNGWGGLVYTLTHLGVLWRDDELIKAAEKITTKIPALIKEDEWHDIIMGSAGCIASLLCLDQIAPSEDTINIAIECGNQLVANSIRMESGIGWTNPANKEKPLVGFSHGTTGIAWALLKLANRTDSHRFSAAAESAIEYERNLFSEKHKNWPDLRKFGNSLHDGDEKNIRYSTTWCHGASGMGLARTQLVKYIDVPELASEIDIAVQTTIEKGFGSNHSLCHGDMGNLDFLLEAYNYTQNAKLKRYTNYKLLEVLESITRYGYKCGNILKVESPGLMTGIAGIGYELLRIAEPKKVPSVLTISAPF